MKHALVAFAATVTVVGLGSCSGDDGTDRTDPSAAEPSSTGAAAGDDPVTSLPGEDLLADGLLTIDNVPTGWAVLPQDDNDDPLCGIRIPELLGLDAETLPSATAEFAEDPDTGPGLVR